MARLFALDHNFPRPIVDALVEFSVEAELVRVDQIDDRMPDLDDWELLLALHHHDRAWDGLITTDSSMLQQPRELAVRLQTRLTLVVAMGSGHDPLKATGLCSPTSRASAIGPSPTNHRSGSSAQPSVLQKTRGNSSSASQSTRTAMPATSGQSSSSMTQDLLATHSSRAQLSAGLQFAAKALPAWSRACRSGDDADVADRRALPERGGHFSDTSPAITAKNNQSPSDEPDAADWVVWAARCVAANRPVRRGKPW